MANLELLAEKGENIVEKPIIISKTGKAHGFGSAKYKWVSGLTKEEQNHVKNNTAIVIVTGCPLSGGNHGITYRVVSYGAYGYKHNMPSIETEMQLYEEKILID